MIEKSPDDYIEYRIHKSFETLKEVQVHIQNKFWNTAVNRMYYACFYAVIALLVKDKLEISSHSGVRQIFGQKYVKTGVINKELAKLYTDLFEKRHKGDYNDFFDFDEETVTDLFPKTELFIVAINELLKK